MFVDRRKHHPRCMDRKTRTVVKGVQRGKRLASLDDKIIIINNNKKGKGRELAGM